MILTRTAPRDLAKLAQCAREFYQASAFLEGFELARFVAFWTQLIENGSGVIFSIEDQSGEIAGTIGGVLYPEIYSGEMIATEFFWFVRPGLRGQGLKLYRAFEAWAREHHCSQIRMVHLVDSMPEKLERVYRHLGFRPCETHYVKSLGGSSL